MLNLVFPIFDAVDVGCAGFLPLSVRVVIWGVVAGIFAMLVYRATSNQNAIAALKLEIKDLQRQMLDPQLDNFADYSAIARRNLAVSVRLLAKTLTPALMSGLPVVLIASWVHSLHGFHLPPAGAEIVARGVPAAGSISVQPQNLARAVADGVAITPQQPDADISFLVDGETVYAGSPFSFPSPTIGKRQWWNVFLEARSGYLSSDADLQEIQFDVPKTRVLSRGPDWLAGWEPLFFVGVFLSAIAMKFCLRLQ